MEHEHEEVEQIPWRMLADQLEERRPRRLATIALAVVAALVAAVVAANVMRRPSGTTVELPAGPASTTVQPAAAPATPTEAGPVDVETDGGAAQPAEIATPGLYSEADLMAMVPLAGDRLVAAQAERFVVDFFTVLGPGANRTGTKAVPQPAADDDGYSWVEWARAAAVVPVAPDRVEVTVLFRTLRRNDDGVFLRNQLRVVIVEIAMEEDGAAIVDGLPRPGAVPALGSDGVFESGDVPDEAAAAALAAIRDWGAEARIEGALTTAFGWRVVVSVVDATRVRWPLMVDVADLSDPES